MLGTTLILLLRLFGNYYDFFFFPHPLGVTSGSLVRNKTFGHFFTCRRL